MDETLKDKSALADKSFIGHDSVFLKLKKLTAAVYLVTGFMDDQEPLKWRLRTRALATLDTGREAIDHQSTTGICLFDRTIESIGQMIALTDLALSIGGLSQMNFSILQREYSLLREQLRQAPSLMSGNPPLTFSQSPTRQPVALSSAKITPTSTNSGLNARREAIIKYLKANNQSSIKDIARSLPQVSSKTVQRELADLVNTGVLKREGDRRWSKYSLN